MDGKRTIELTAVQKSEFVLIKVTNDAIDGGAKSINGNIISKKKNKDKHGMGLKSIKLAIEKYDGEMDTVFENNKFTLSILLNI